MFAGDQYLVANCTSVVVDTRHPTACCTSLFANDQHPRASCGFMSADAQDPKINGAPMNVDAPFLLNNSINKKNSYQELEEGCRQNKGLFFYVNDRIIDR